MELIDKSALVAEIEKLNPPFYPTLAEKYAYQDAIKDCFGVVCNVEMKEVELEREIGFFTTKELLKKRNFSTSVFHLTQNDIDNIAKHFFELGLKTQKGE